MSSDVQSDLSASAKGVCDLVRSTLGPFGANKLIVQNTGGVTTTSIGSVVLEQLDVAGPVVTVLQRASTDVRDRYGDGATTAVVLTGELLAAAEDLTEVGLHPTAIERGYRTALDAALDHLDAQGRPGSAVGTAAVARTALTPIRDPQIRDRMGSIVEQTATSLAAEHGPEAFDRDRVGVVTRTGGAMAESELIRGVALERGTVVDSMPRAVEDAGVAVFSSTVDVETIGSAVDRSSGVTLSMELDSFEDEVALGEREREAFRRALSSAVDAGCRVVVTSRAVNDRVKRDLANEGVLAIQRVDDGVARRIARLTGATVVPTFSHVDESTLGRGSVSVERKAGKSMSFVTSDAGEQLYTLFGRAPDPRMTDAFEHALESALAAVASTARTDRVVAGGGAVEASAARAVGRRARATDTREQFAEEAFGRALMTVPRTLARNAGMDATTAVTRLRVAHSEGRSATGVDAFASDLRDVTDGDPVVEPLELKRAVWETATDLAVKLIRIDDRLDASDLLDEEGADEDAPSPTEIVNG
jgi:chaperonin GroEL (HSP60 family)